MILRQTLPRYPAAPAVANVPARQRQMDSSERTHPFHADPAQVQLSPLCLAMTCRNLVVTGLVVLSPYWNG